MSYTLGQAAKATGFSKPTISEAIKKGKISARKNENGSFEIDPAELHRIYPPLASTVSKEEPESEPFRTHDLTTKIMALEAQIKAIGELKDQITAERDDLRTERDRLLGVIEEQAGSVKQLTFQPQPQSQQATNSNPRRSFWAAFKGLFLAGLVVLLVVIAALAASSFGLLWKQSG